MLHMNAHTGPKVRQGSLGIKPATLCFAWTVNCLPGLGLILAEPVLELPGPCYDHSVSS